MILSSDMSSAKAASMWQRSFAAIVDMLVVFCAVYYSANRWGTKLPNGGRGWQDWSAVAAFSLIAAYWIVPEWYFGCTIGKFMFGLRVQSASNKRITFVQSLKRNLLRPVDFIFFYFIGFVVARLNPLRQRLGDQWAGTFVARFRTRTAPDVARVPNP